MTTKSFLKWVGSKASLLPEILPLIPEFNSYYEPFLGSGALYCALDLTGKNVYLNDSNAELIRCWRTVHDDCEELIEHLQTHENTKEYYLNLRQLDRQPNWNSYSFVERASRFIFLNKTCYNGLWRVNKKGEMNTPYGKYKNPNWCNKSLLRKISNKLRVENVWLSYGDYGFILDTIVPDEKGVFVYLDPPYDVLNSTSNFTSYTHDKFDVNEQHILSQQVAKLHEHGIKFLMSNSDTKLIRDLYQNFIISEVKCKRNVNCDASKRGKVTELLIRNYEV